MKKPELFKLKILLLSLSIFPCTIGKIFYVCSYNRKKCRWMTISWRKGQLQVLEAKSGANILASCVKWPSYVTILVSVSSSVRTGGREEGSLQFWMPRSSEWKRVSSTLMSLIHFFPKSAKQWNLAMLYYFVFIFSVT